MRTKPFDRGKAVAYAHKWAYGRIPAFYDFSKIGGDCTNFASQVIYAGTGVMNYSGDLGWFYISADNRSPSWTGVEYLYRFIVFNNGPGPVAVETDIFNAQAGDVIQLLFDGEAYEHSPVVISAGSPASPDNILLAAHTLNSDFRPLYTYEYKKARCLHIINVNLA